MSDTPTTGVTIVCSECFDQLYVPCNPDNYRKYKEGEGTAAELMPHLSRYDWEFLATKTCLTCLREIKREQDYADCVDRDYDNQSQKGSHETES
jgi:hypothetical protein